MGEQESTSALRSRLQESPYDQDAWDDLIDELKAQKDVTAVREAYEALVAEFPTAAQYWKDYAEFEVGHGGDNAAKAIFSRCLLQCPSVDLWRSYLKLVRRSNERKGVAGLPELRQAFEYTLDRLGQDALAGPIWEEYIAFLEAPKAGTPEHEALFGAASQEDSARVVALRRAFHKALLVPGPSLDALWSAYESFEMGGENRTLAKRAIDEWRPLWQAARALSRRRTELVRRLAWHALPTPPGKSLRPRVASAAAAAAREWLAWEISNQQSLDESAYASRVTLCFEQVMSLHPGRADLALTLADWHEHGGGDGPPAALAALQEARVRDPGCLALHLATAEAHERAGQVAEAKAVYEEVVSGCISSASGGTESGINNDTVAGDVPKTSDVPETEGNDDVTNDAAETVNPDPPTTTSLVFDPEQGTLAWVQYMRFAARTEGLTAARKIFLRARKGPSIGWRVFAASADLEWAGAAGGPDTVARNVFELGLQTHLKESAYVLHYLKFLRARGDLTNARALLERALKEYEDGSPLFDAYLDMEVETGNQSAIAAIERRRREELLIKVVGNDDDAAGLERKVARSLALGLSAAVIKYGVLGALPAEPADAIEWRRAADRYTRASSISTTIMGTNQEEVEEDVFVSRQPNNVEKQHNNNEHVAEDYRASRRSYGKESEDETQSASVARPRGSSRWSPEPEGADRRLNARSLSPVGPPTIPREMQLFMNELPPAHVFEGPLPDIDQVLSVAMANDYTPAGIDAHEAAAARERRRQRAAQGQAPPGALSGASVPYDPTAYGGPPQQQMGGGFKRKPDYASDSGDEEPWMGGYGGGGADLYRMRRAKLSRPQM